MFRLKCVENRITKNILNAEAPGFAWSYDPTSRVRREGIYFSRIPERGLLEKSCLTNAATIYICWRVPFYFSPSQRKAKLSSSLRPLRLRGKSLSRNESERKNGIRY